MTTPTECRACNRPATLVTAGGGAWCTTTDQLHNDAKRIVDFGVDRPPGTDLRTLCVIRGCLNPRAGTNLCAEHWAEVTG